MLESLRPSILRHFARIEDPRQSAKVLYPLAEVLLLALAATIAGAVPRDNQGENPRQSG